MSTQNPLIPQGTFQAQAARGASNVRLAVATIVAIHVVFFGGLLLQGCKRDPQTTQSSQATNAEPSTNMGLPPLDSSSLYYSNSSNLPTDTGTAVSATAPEGRNAFTTQTPAASAESLWQTTNLSSSLPPGQTGGTHGSGATKEYTVARGDSFSRIAVRNGTTVSALRAANPNVDPVRIKPGDKLNVPEAAPQSAAAPSNGALTASGSATTTYIVKTGDTLTKVAHKHGITIKQLSSANNLRTGRINVGQKLKIPAPSPQASSGTTSKVAAPGL